MADKDFVVKNGIVVNTSFTANSTQFALGSSVTGNGSGIYTTGTVNAVSHTIGATAGINSTAVYVTSASLNSSILSIGGNPVANTTGANNTFNLGGQPAANFVNSSQLSANLSNYTTTTSLTANLANYVANAFVNTAIANYLPNYTGYVNAALFTTTGNVVITSSANSVVSIGNTAANVVINSSSISINGNILANSSGAVNAASLGGQSPTYYVSNTFLTSNYSNASSISATLGNYVQNTFLTSNYSNTSSINTTLSTYVQNTYLQTTLGAYVTNSGSFNITGVYTFSGNLVINTSSQVIANGSFGANGQALLSNGSSVYWGNVATSGGATGNGTDAVFLVGGQTVNNSYTTNGSLNYLSAGPITINQPAVVTITTGSRWAIV